MATFLKAYNMQGYDHHRVTHWQMVPLMGWRYVALRDGAALTVTSTNPSVCSITEIKHKDLSTGGERMPLQASDRVFLLFGSGAGAAVIQAVGGAGAVNLEVDVKNRMTVRITFNFVKDTAHHHTRRVPAQAAQWVKTMNYIMNGQANIDVISKDAHWVTVPKDLGNVVTTLKSGVGEEADIYPLGDPAADVNMFLVWAMDITDDPADEDAFTEGKRIVFEDNAGYQVGETMTHELGHALSLADQYTTKYELMYGLTDMRGIHVGKDHVNAMNP